MNILVPNIDTEASKEFAKVVVECLQLFDRKQKDYGPLNISDFGELGVIVRMNDKFQRLKNLRFSGKRRPKNEPIEDTYKDIANYAIIAILLRRGLWPSYTPISNRRRPRRVDVSEGTSVRPTDASCTSESGGSAP